MSRRELAELIRECDSLSRCEGCGSFVVSIENHTCSTEGAGRDPTRPERERRAARDGRDDGDTVGVYCRSRGDAYAYHELDGGVPVCGCHSYTEARLRTTTRGEAKRRGRSPCGTCSVVLE